MQALAVEPLGVDPPVWPLHGVRLTTADLGLTVTVESDLATLARVLPDDVEQDPEATTYAGLDVVANRHAVLAQAYWRALGTWSPRDWALPFTVHRDGAVVGMQWLESTETGEGGVVDSSSWLVPEARGRGWGRQMRAAVLSLAFGPLGARAAVSSAVLANGASLGVSRALGYENTHRSVLEHSGEVLQHLRLERVAWEASRAGDPVTVHGVDLAVLALFGIEEA
ncbi:MAG: GNAT family N-acetyltransferase [Humibacillus sp.]